MVAVVGTRLGPYEILGSLGAGGMGEVFRARDTRLGRDVALKVLRPDVAVDADRLARFEREAKAVAALNHPNILTVHDVGTHEGAPYVVTELLEGESLREVLLRRSPTHRQALGWVAQAAQGLAAAHQKGIVHRDVKPENLFLTADGRLKILDFGLAKIVTPAEAEAETATQESTPGVVLGTVAYMSPEQVRAEAVDHRTDLFSLGVVLYELLSGAQPFRRDTTPATLTAILHETPLSLGARDAAVPPAVERIVARCLEKDRESRFQSAHDLALAAEAVLVGAGASAALRDVEERSPFPGLSSFTEEDAGSFFGREVEVESLWKGLRERRLLAVIGPSGAGKTSFVRAGVVPARPAAWAAIVATPGSSPLRGLGQVLGPQLAGDPGALRRLAAFEEGDTAFELVVRWRRNHDEALVVVDQFEELFTLNSADVQTRFASLLGRLAAEGDVRVLLSLRDDFLMRCHEYAPLAPVFRELTPLGPMTEAGLRRALVEPAARRGYRFEDEALVDEMIGAVGGARSALPLLAFAVSRLWERRRPDEKVLTREAYAEIGGVAGALARHAEETLERIGTAHEGMVRTIFRNLTTAQSTRAVLDREELLSALSDRPAAESVLNKLIDARLLSSWETEAADGQPARHRVEIVHESLLSAWPRLVRWQTQDADGAQLRDQLRQAAHLWEERGKTDDLLWTGSTYLDYRAWRAHYPGKLSSLEEAFGSSMAARAERTRRRRRTAVGSALVASLLGLAIMAALWGRSQAARTHAEAAKLLAMARLEVDTDPTAALAYATRSIELDDTQQTRFFALRLTQNMPVARLFPGANYLAMSPDGQWIAVLREDEIVLLNQDGRTPVTISPGEHGKGTFARGGAGTFVRLAFGPDSKTLSLLFRDETRVLSVPDGREVGRTRYARAGVHPVDDEAALRVEGTLRTFLVRPLDGGEERVIGTMESPGGPSWPSASGTSYSRVSLAWALGRKLFVRDPLRWASPPRLLGEHPTLVQMVSLSRDGQRLAAVDKSGEIRIWDTASSSGSPLRVLPADRSRAPAGDYGVWFTPPGRWVMSDVGAEGYAWLRLWDLEAPPGAEPLLLRSKSYDMREWLMDAQGRGFGASDADGSYLRFWPQPHTPSRVFDWRQGQAWQVSFTPDGRSLVGVSSMGNVRAWPLSADAEVAFTDLPKADLGPGVISAAPTRREILVPSGRGRVQVMAVDGGEARELTGMARRGWSGPSAYSPDGRRVVAAPWEGPAAEKKIHVWDLESGTVQALEPVPKTDDQRVGGFRGLSFVDNDRIAATVEGNGLMVFSIRSGKGQVLSSAVEGRSVFGRSGRIGIALDCDRKNSSCRVLRFALDGTAPVALPYRVTMGAGGDASLALDPSETVVASTGPEDSIQIGPKSGGEPHLLFGHKGEIDGLAFSPDGKWLASAGSDQTIRLWPIPDITKVPPHRRSKEDFLATLRTFTNVRAVADPKAPNGWKLEPGPFPGWQAPPSW